MSTRNLFRVLSRRLLINDVCKRYKGYKVVKRPDPKTLKMPNLADAPSIMTIIKEKLRLNGPLTVAEYMHIVITNPTEGYYEKKDTIGETGDFITSPEISQLFGEIMAVWFYAETQKMCPGKPLQIVELGPGKGTLMIDILRVLNRYGYKAADLSLHLVEISSTMQLVQANRLCASHSETDLDSPYNREGETVSGIKVYWYNDLKKVPNNFSWYIAHEFFDVLPIHKFQKTEEGWREVLIDLDENDKLRYRISANETQSTRVLVRPPLDAGDRMDLEISPRSLGIARQLANRVDQFGGLALIADYGHSGEKGDTFRAPRDLVRPPLDAGDRMDLEISPRSLGIARQLANRVDQFGGLALIADYGHSGEKGDTFRAFHKHKIVDPLEDPGTADLTADVDFSQLRIAASMTPGDENYALVVGPVTQMEFLARLQADARLQMLVDNAKTENEKEKIKAAYDMLVNPKKMGERFKFMAFYPSGMAQILEKYPPLGFSTP